MKTALQQINDRLDRLNKELEQLTAVKPRLLSTTTAIAINIELQDELVKAKDSLTDYVPSRTGGNK